MNKLKYLTLVLSFLISFNSFYHIAFADDHGENKYIYEENENDYDNYNYDEIPDELEDEKETDSETDDSDKSDSELYD